MDRDAMKAEVEKIEAENKASAETVFRKWLDQPITRIAMSMVPPGEHPETLKVLLRGAFDQGVSAGEANVFRQVFAKLIRGS